MLFKGDSEMARSASLAVQPQAGPGSRPVQAVPDPRDVRIAELEKRLAEREAELAAARQSFEQQLREREKSARAAAGSEFRQDDTARIALLHKAVTQALASFERACEVMVEPTARDLAREAFSTLVESSAEEEAWIGRLARRRIREMQAGSLVAVRYGANALSAGAIEELATVAGPRVRFEADGKLDANSVVLDLRIGHVVIDQDAADAAVGAVVGCFDDA